MIVAFNMWEVSILKIKGLTITGYRCLGLGLDTGTLCAFPSWDRTHVQR